MAKDAAPRRFAAQNRRARHDYLIESTLESGIQLTGTEVKSLREGRASIGEAYAGEKDGELYLLNAHIPEYAASRVNHEPRRARKLLVHKREMRKLLGAVTREGKTLVPLSIYFNKRGRAKVDLALASGKHKGDKREAIKERDWKREQARLMRGKGKE
ncbi:MAG: SsrA-binding protein SmpB [Rhodospirillales bacterium]|nr:SsrA-binding protein SmpB [Rhodospirillales bacterium]